LTSNQGASFIFQSLVAPTLTQYEESIDHSLQEAASQAKQIFVKWVKTGLIYLRDTLKSQCGIVRSLLYFF